MGNDFNIGCRYKPLLENKSKEMNFAIPLEAKGWIRSWPFSSILRFGG